MENNELQTEEVLKKAEHALEALLGPFRLSKTVRQTLKQGLLMPFELSMTKGKRAARVSNGRGLREVKVQQAPARRLQLSRGAFNHPII